MKGRPGAHTLAQPARQAPSPGRGEPSHSAGEEWTMGWRHSGGSRRSNGQWAGGTQEAPGTGTERPQGTPVTAEAPWQQPAFCSSMPCASHHPPPRVAHLPRFDPMRAMAAALSRVAWRQDLRAQGAAALLLCAWRAL